MLEDKICPRDLRFIPRPRRMLTILIGLLRRLCVFLLYAAFVYLVGSGSVNVVLAVSYFIVILLCVKFARIMFCKKLTRLEENARRVRVLVGTLDSSEFDLAEKKLFNMSQECLSALRRDAGNSTPNSDTNMVATQAKDMLITTKDEKQPIETDRLFIAKDPIPIIGRQTFPQWKVALEMGSLFSCGRKSRERILFLQPVGEFPAFIRCFQVSGKPLFHLLQDFASAFFAGMRVEILDAVEADIIGCTTRCHKVTGKKQILVSDLNSKLPSVVNKRTKHDFVLGITWTDLYPSEDLNFVLGEASYKNKCAVLSFGRYEPRSYQGNKTDDDGDITDINGEILWRLIKVLSHETCHLFGLSHCVFFDCAMNESSSLDEAMSQPLFLCPICLRKLQHALGFDIRRRYNNLVGICRLIQLEYPTTKMADAIAWLDKCSVFLNTFDAKDMV